MVRYIVKTYHGLEEVLQTELQELGGEDVQVLNRACSFEGDLKTMYKVNLHCRTALRVLKPIYAFEAMDEHALYKKAYDIPWTNFLELHQTFAIDAIVNSPHFNHNKYVALKVKDAIVDQFRNKTGKRPSIDVNEPDIRFNVHISRSDVSISLDSSGSSLHRRGYRDPRHQAPLNEALAAGMVMLSGWTPDQPLLDPMCGTGTILVEAAMIARNIAPRMSRKYFAFMNWPDFDASLWEEVVDEARAAVNNVDFKIYGGDQAFQAVKIARDTLRRMGWSNEIKISKMPFDEYMKPAEEGVIITNPPYGVRMDSASIISTYQEIGDHLKKNYAGWDAWIISSNMQALKRVGLRPSRKITLFNGSLECKFMKFSMYSGSKRTKFQTQSESSNNS